MAPKFCKSRAHLVGKVTIITGSNTGIGYETAKDFAERGARVILACRDPKRANAAKQKLVDETGNNNIVYKKLDLASFDSVREFAKDILETEERLDILVNNAALYGFGDEKTADGLNLMIQTNHFGPFLLTCLLVPMLKKSAPSRIVNVTSLAHIFGSVDPTDLNITRANPMLFYRYASTKLCNILMTVELARRLDGSGVTTNCCHPGVVTTELFRNKNAFSLESVVKMFLTHLTPWEGAQTTIHLAVCREVNVTGKYFDSCKEAETSKDARDIELAMKVWIESAKIVGCSPDV